MLFVIYFPGDSNMFINLNLIGILNNSPSGIKVNTLSSLKNIDSKFASLLNMLTSMSADKSGSTKPINGTTLTAALTKTLFSNHREGCCNFSPITSPLHLNIKDTKNREIEITFVPEKVLKKIFDLLSTGDEKGNTVLDSSETAEPVSLKAESETAPEKNKDILKDNSQLNLSILILPDMKEHRRLYLISMDNTKHNIPDSHTVDTDTHPLQPIKNHTFKSTVNHPDKKDSAFLLKNTSGVFPEQALTDTKHYPVNEESLIPETLMENLKEIALDIDNIFSSIDTKKGILVLNRSKTSMPLKHDFEIESASTQALKNIKNEPAQTLIKDEKLILKPHKIEHRKQRHNRMTEDILNGNIKDQGSHIKPHDMVNTNYHNLKYEGQKAGKPIPSDQSFNETLQAKTGSMEKIHIHSSEHNNSPTIDEPLTKDSTPDTLVSKNKPAETLTVEEVSVKDSSGKQTEDTNKRQEQRGDNHALFNRPLEHHTEQGIKHIFNRENHFAHVLTKIKEHIIAHQENSKLHTIKLSIDTGNKGNIDLKVMIHNGTVKADIILDNLNDLMELKNNIASLYSSLQQDGFTPGRFSFNLKNQNRQHIPIDIDGQGLSDTEIQDNVISKGIYNLSIRI